MAATEPNAVTAAELGELLGVSTRAVADLGKRGIAVKAGPSRWRLRESVARYCDDLRRQAKGKGGEAAAQSGGGWAQADLVALRVAKQRGELLDAGALRRERQSDDFQITAASQIVSCETTTLPGGPSLLLLLTHC